MAAPNNEVIQMEYQNPDASAPLFVPVLVISNTPDEILAENIRINSAKDLPWLKSCPAHDGVAVMIGGGPSIKDEIETICHLMMEKDVAVFAMNAASHYLHAEGIPVDYQCIVDAKPESKDLIDPMAENHIFASQVNPETMDSIDSPIVCHLEIGEVEQFFPPEKRAKGGYVLLGGGAAVGNSALCMAYALGFREFHIFGYDSCHKEGKSHAYPQDMNLFIPTTEVTWAGKKFTASVAMKAQAERFQFTSKALKNRGCKLHVYGEGLLQTMYYAKPEDLTEKEKYQLMWEFDTYREHSPGEKVAELFLNLFEPHGTIIDFGCGTGRAGIIFVENGLDTLLVDFASNCRDEEAQVIPFVEWDLTNPMPFQSDYGYCTDVMEHIPPEDVEKVIKNILNSAGKVFFQISTVQDEMGEAIDQPLHLTVMPHEWWKEIFSEYSIEWEQKLPEASIFYVSK